MELLINKRVFMDGDSGRTSVVEPVVRVPYEPGPHQTTIGEITLQLGEFNPRKGIEKVVVFSEALHARNSDNRRVVEFSRRFERVVSQDISPTERYEFIRQG